MEFAYTITKYDRRFRGQKRDLILTASNLFIIGREKIAKGPPRAAFRFCDPLTAAGPNKGKFEEVIKRQLEMAQIGSVSLSFVLSVRDCDSRSQHQAGRLCGAALAERLRHGH